MKIRPTLTTIATLLFACVSAAITPYASAADDSALQTHVHAWYALKAESVAKADIMLRIKNPPAQTGQLMIGLYDAQTPFPDEGKHLMNALVPVNGGSSEYTFRDIPLGVYAIAVICDENGNGTLDKRFGLLPAEPLAFSNGATAGAFGPPKFVAASFTLAAGGRVLDLVCQK